MRVFSSGHREKRSWGKRTVSKRQCVRVAGGDLHDDAVGERLHEAYGGVGALASQLAGVVAAPREQRAAGACAVPVGRRERDRVEVARGHTDHAVRLENHHLRWTRVAAFVSELSVFVAPAAEHSAVLELRDVEYRIVYKCLILTNTTVRPQVPSTSNDNKSTTRETTKEKV